jgi:hypothetical protein
LLFTGIEANSTWKQHSGAIAVSYDITPSITAQVFYAGASAEMAQPAGYYDNNFVPGPGYTGSIPAGTYSLLEDGGYGNNVLQSSDLVEEKLTAYVGRGILRLAAVQDNTFNSQYADLYPPSGQYTLYGTACVGTATANPACPSGGTYTVYNGTPASLAFYDFLYSNAGRVNNRDLLASYAVQVGSRSSVGASYVTSYYNNLASINEDLVGIFDFGFSEPTATSETTTEVRLHASTQVSDKLSLDASWYFAHGVYHVPNPNDPTGNTWVTSTAPYSAPRVSAVWRANSNTSVRLAAGGGFALPQLGELVSTNSIMCGTTVPATACFQSLDNLNLAPEKSFGINLGADMRLHHNTVLSFDLYRTNLYGQIFQGSNEETYSGSLCSSPPCQLFTTQYNNLGESRYEGINIDIRHDVPKGIYWHGELGLTRAYVVSLPAGFYNTAGSTCSAATYTTTCQDTYIVPGINFDGQYQSTVPYAKGSAQIGYRWSPGKYVDLEPTYYGNNNAYFQPAFVEFDAHAGYLLTKNVSLLATFSNITGIHGQAIQSFSPFGIALTAPTTVGVPYGEFGLPYGPRTVIVTANIHL